MIKPTTFAVLLFSTATSYAYPIFPKSYRAIGPNLAIHEIRAQVAEPTPSEYAQRTIGWPLSTVDSRQLEKEIEIAVSNKMVTDLMGRPTVDSKYAVAMIRVIQGDIERQPQFHDGKEVRRIKAHLSFMLLPSGVQIGNIPLVFQSVTPSSTVDRPLFELTTVAERSAATTVSATAKIVLDFLSENCEFLLGD